MFTDAFGTSVPKFTPPPIFSYLFLSSKSFTTTLLADTFNFSFSLSEPITAPMLVKFSVSIFPPFLAINELCLFTHSFSPFPLPFAPAFDIDKSANLPSSRFTDKLTPVCDDELEEVNFSSAALISISFFAVRLRSFPTFTSAPEILILPFFNFICIFF